MISPIETIIEDIRQGKMVILVDAEDRENEGDLVLAAHFASSEHINFMIKEGRGLVCLTLTDERCRTLGLDMMTKSNGTKYGTAFTVSIEAAEGVTTGISSADRAHTIRTAVDRHASQESLVQPGHVFPLRAQDGGVLVRAGHTEAGCDLAQLAGLQPASVICEIMNDDGSMARLPDLEIFAEKHGLNIGTIADLIRYRSQTESLIEQVSEKIVHTPYGIFQLYQFKDIIHKNMHYALCHGKIDSSEDVCVRVHEPFSAVDLLDPSYGQHSWPLPEALYHIQQHTSGIAVLLTSHEEHTYRESIKHTHWDQKTFGIGAQILKKLGVKRMHLLSRELHLPSVTGFDLDILGCIPYDPSRHNNPKSM